MPTLLLGVKFVTTDRSAIQIGEDIQGIYNYKVSRFINILQIDPKFKLMLLFKLLTYLKKFRTDIAFGNPSLKSSNKLTPVETLVIVVKHLKHLISVDNNLCMIYFIPEST